MKSPLLEERDIMNRSNGNLERRVIYFRHATGQLYAISRELASYISINQKKCAYRIILHKYVNEDVSLGYCFWIGFGECR
ncbi:hypothetical protein YC2023_009409 [Brassica napus]